MGDPTSSHVYRSNLYRSNGRSHNLPMGRFHKLPMGTFIDPIWEIPQASNGDGRTQWLRYKIVLRYKTMVKEENKKYKTRGEQKIQNKRRTMVKEENKKYKTRGEQNTIVKVQNKRRTKHNG